jgi:integrase
VKGSTFKRCGCTDGAGKPLGDACPRLKSKNHGSWYYAADLPPHPGERRRYKRKGGFATRREAEAALAELVDRVQKRTHLDAGNMTTAGYLKQWLDGKAKLRSSAHRSYDLHITLYLEPGLGHLRLVDLTAQDIEQLYAAMRQLGHTRPAEASPVVARLLAARKATDQTRPLSAASIKRVHATLMSALNTAAKHRLIPFNPAAYVELDSGRRPKAVVWTPERVAAWRATGRRPKVAVWTAQQTATFLDQAADDRLYALYHLIAFRGLRRGEAVGLSWTDPTLIRGCSTSAGRSSSSATPPKEENPRRTARAPSSSIETPSLSFGRIAPGRPPSAWRGAPAWTDSGRMFTKEDGAELHPEYVTRHFEQLYRRAELPPIRLHDLRHGAATLALAGGADLKRCQKCSGTPPSSLPPARTPVCSPRLHVKPQKSTAALVRRSRRPGPDSPAPILHPSDADEATEDTDATTKGQAKRVGRVGLEPTTRGLKEHFGWSGAVPNAPWCACERPGGAGCIRRRPHGLMSALMSGRSRLRRICIVEDGRPPAGNGRLSARTPGTTDRPHCTAGCPWMSCPGFRRGQSCDRRLGRGGSHAAVLDCLQPHARDVGETDQQSRESAGSFAARNGGGRLHTARLLVCLWGHRRLRALRGPG